ncbi:MAG: hypothetical protein ACRYG4_01850 [Janthinobacterium lividum]
MAKKKQHPNTYTIRGREAGATEAARFVAAERVAAVAAARATTRQIAADAGLIPVARPRHRSASDDVKMMRKIDRRQRSANVQGALEGRRLHAATLKRQRTEEREALELDATARRVRSAILKSERDAAALARCTITVSRPKELEPLPEFEAHKTSSSRASKRRPAVDRDGLANVVCKIWACGDKPGKRAPARSFASKLLYIMDPFALDGSSANAVHGNMVGQGVDGTMPVAGSDAYVYEGAALADTVVCFERDIARTVAGEKIAQHFVHIVIALPAGLTGRQRRRAAMAITARLERAGVPYTAAVHRPSATGDDRNYHLHIVSSARPFVRHGPRSWSFAPTKDQGLFDPVGIRIMRADAAHAFNRVLSEARIDTRYTHLTRAERGLGRMTHRPDVTTDRKAASIPMTAQRQLEALEEIEAHRQRLLALVRDTQKASSHLAAIVRSATAERLARLRSAAERLDRQREVIARRVETRRATIESLKLSAEATAAKLAAQIQAARGVVQAQMRQVAGLLFETQRLANSAQAARAVNLQALEARSELVDSLAAKIAAAQQRLETTMAVVDRERAAQIQAARDAASSRLRLVSGLMFAINRAAETAASVRREQMQALEVILENSKRLATGIAASEERLAARARAVEDARRSAHLARQRQALDDLGARLENSMARTVKASEKRVLEATARLNAVAKQRAEQAADRLQQLTVRHAARWANIIEPAERHLMRLQTNLKEIARLATTAQELRRAAIEQVTQQRSVLVRARFRLVELDSKLQSVQVDLKRRVTDSLAETHRQLERAFVASQKLALESQAAMIRRLKLAALLVGRKLALEAARLELRRAAGRLGKMRQMLLTGLETRRDLYRSVAVRLQEAASRFGEIDAVRQPAVDRRIAVIEYGVAVREGAKKHLHRIREALQKQVNARTKEIRSITTSEGAVLALPATPALKPTAVQAARGLDVAHGLLAEYIEAEKADRVKVVRDARGQLCGHCRDMDARRVLWSLDQSEAGREFLIRLAAPASNDEPDATDTKIEANRIAFDPDIVATMAFAWSRWKTFDDNEREDIARLLHSFLEVRTFFRVGFNSSVGTRVYCYRETDAVILQRIASCAGGLEVLVDAVERLSVGPRQKNLHYGWVVNLQAPRTLRTSPEVRGSGRPPVAPPRRRDEAVSNTVQAVANLTDIVEIAAVSTPESTNSYDLLQTAQRKRRDDPGR